MSRRLLTAALIVAALLADRVTAKPPDLPLPQNDVLAPETPAPTSQPDLFPPAAAPAPEPSLFFRVRPSVRRTMASCLLFAANPLLALAPTEEYVDFDEDDAPQAAFPELFVTSAWDKTNTGSLLSSIGVNSDAAPAGAVKYITLEMAVALASHDEPQSSQQLFPRQAAKPEDSTPSACPWMRQQQCDPDRHAVLSADIDLSHDVLDNLEMLRQAHELLRDAQELGRAGQILDALDCLEQAHDLCPHVWLDEKIREASAEIFADSYRDSPWDNDAGASLQPCLPPVDPQVPAVLDDLYPETPAPVQLAADDEEQKPPADVLKDVAKPFVKEADPEEVGCAEDGGSPMSCVDVLKAFAALVPPEYGELAIGQDGGVRVFTRVRCGGAVWRLLYDNGALSVWASPDGGADAEAPAENPPDDASGD